MKYTVPMPRFVIEDPPAPSVSDEDLLAGASRTRRRCEMLGVDPGKFRIVVTPDGRTLAVPGKLG